MIFDKSDILLKDFRPEHSEFQMSNFIIGNNDHPWMRYHQALRELSGRHDEIKAMCMQIRFLKRQLKTKPEKMFFIIPRFWRRNDKTRIELELKKVMEKIKPKMREYKFFYRAAKDLKKVIGDIDIEKRKQLDAEAWKHRALCMAAIDLLSIKMLQRSTMEFIISFPKNIRSEILYCLTPGNRDNLFEQIGYIDNKKSIE